MSRKLFGSGVKWAPIVKHSCLRAIMPDKALMVSWTYRCYIGAYLQTGAYRPMLMIERSGSLL